MRMQKRRFCVCWRINSHVVNRKSQRLRNFDNSTLFLTRIFCDLPDRCNSPANLQVEKLCHWTCFDFETFFHLHEHFRFQKKRRKACGTFENISISLKSRIAKAKENHQKLLCYDLWTKKALYTEKSLQARWKKEIRRRDSILEPRVAMISSHNILFCLFFAHLQEFVFLKHQKSLWCERNSLFGEL